MDPGVQAAWISSSVALGVAVIGVIATGIAQGRGTKKAHENALALFKTQAAEQDRIRAEEAAERKNAAFLADRRAVYARFIGAMERLHDAAHEYDEVTERSSALVAEPDGGQERDKELRASLPEIEAATQSRLAASKDVSETIDEILLLAPGEVANAARDWYRIREDEYIKGYGGFIAAARFDVGAQPPVPRPPL